MYRWVMIGVHSVKLSKTQLFYACVSWVKSSRQRERERAVNSTVISAQVSISVEQRPDDV